MTYHYTKKFKNSDLPLTSPLIPPSFAKEEDNTPISLQKKPPFQKGNSYSSPTDYLQSTRNFFRMGKQNTDRIVSLFEDAKVGDRIFVTFDTSPRPGVRHRSIYSRSCKVLEIRDLPTKGNNIGHKEYKIYTELPIVDDITHVIFSENQTTQSTDIRRQPDNSIILIVKK